MSTHDAQDVRARQLEQREAQLVEMLQRCIPPVDQHRHELQIVRAQLAEARKET